MKEGIIAFDRRWIWVLLLAKSLDNWKYLVFIMFELYLWKWQQQNYDYFYYAQKLDTIIWSQTLLFKLSGQVFWSIPKKSTEPICFVLSVSLFLSLHPHYAHTLTTATPVWVHFRHAMLSHVDFASALNFRHAAVTQTNSRCVEFGRCACDRAFSLKGSSLPPLWPSPYVLIWMHANACFYICTLVSGRPDAYSPPGIWVFHTQTNTPQLCFNFMVSTCIYINIH